LGRQAWLQVQGEMNFEAQGTARLAALMLAGAVFACVGLWLLLRPKPSGAAAKIELFGLKFESSSAGVLVFLIGAAFLALPLFVPEKAVRPAIGGTNKTVGSSTGAVGSDATLSTQSGQEALLLPPDPEVAESEPNNRVQSANQIGLGQTVSGKVRKGDDDWFVVAVPAEPAFVDLRVRKIGGGNFRAKFLNAREESIDYASLYELESRYVRAEVLDNDRFYVLVWSESAADYEIAVLPVAD
jgi:hypothetical protein